MEEDKVDSVVNGSSSEGLPPNPLAAAYKQSFNNDHVALPCKKSLVRHPSLVSSIFCFLQFCYLG